MPAVRIEEEAFSDERYDDLAAISGLADGDHARMKMARLWRQCTLENTYFLPRVMVERVLGPRAIEALAVARLGELADDGTVRIRGTRGRIEWLARVRAGGKKGGRPRSLTPKPPGSPQEPQGLCKTKPPQEQEQEQESSSLSPDLVPSRADGGGDLVRTPTPAEVSVNLGLVDLFCSEVHAARTRVARKHSLQMPRPLFNQGRWTYELVARVRETTQPGEDPAAIVRRAVAAAEADALEDPKAIRWLSESICEPKAWRVKLNTALPDKARIAAARAAPFAPDVSRTQAELDELSAMSREIAAKGAAAVVAKMEPKR